MWTRRIVGSALMLGSVALIVGTSLLKNHGGDLVFYTVYAIALATFLTAWLGGWFWDAVLGDKRKSLTKIFAISLIGLLILGLGPTVAATLLGKGPKWADSWRMNLLLIVGASNVIWTLRRTKPFDIKVH